MSVKISPAHGNTLLRKAFNSWCFSQAGEILRRGVYTRMLWAFQNLMGHQIKLYKLPQPYFLFPSKNNNLSPIYENTNKNSSEFLYLQMVGLLMVMTVKSRRWMGCCLLVPFLGSVTSSHPPCRNNRRFLATAFRFSTRTKSPKV